MAASAIFCLWIQGLFNMQIPSSRIGKAPTMWSGVCSSLVTVTPFSAHVWHRDVPHPWSEQISAAGNGQTLPSLVKFLEDYQNQREGFCGQRAVGRWGSCVRGSVEFLPRIVRWIPVLKSTAVADSYLAKGTKISFTVLVLGMVFNLNLSRSKVGPASSNILTCFWKLLELRSYDSRSI